MDQKPHPKTVDSYGHIVRGSACDRPVGSHAQDCIVVTPNLKEGAESESVCQEADRIAGVGGPRSGDYGHPYDNFTDIAAGWSVIFGTEVSPEQVARAMIWLKICRQGHKEQRDNLVDIKRLRQM